MTIADTINGIYEMTGSIAVAWNCVTTYRDKEIKGISLGSMIFFTSWGFWNLYYYPSLHQWISTLGAASMVLFNTIWLFQAIYYTNLNKKKKLNALYNPVVGMVTKNETGNTAEILEVAEHWIKGQYADGRKFTRCKRGFMKNYKPIKPIKQQI